ncbi:MAG: DUF3157 family protein [Gammaproteobacteria bacterium]
MTLRSVVTIALITLAGLPALVHAGFIIVTTPDGREVRLKDDFTWEYLDGQGGAMTAPTTAPAGGSPQGRSTQAKNDELALLDLTLERVDSRASSCSLGIRLTNNAGYLVTSIVPRITAWVRDGTIAYDTQSVEFSSIKPLRSEYETVKFFGIPCEKIDWLQVHGGDRCTLDNLDKFSPNKGECISRVKVIPNEWIEWKNLYSVEK